MISRTEFVRNYPKVYHMAVVGSWPSISRFGLLSTSALLDLFDVRDSRRFAIESSHRPHSVLISHPVHGTAMIRDQIPMRETALQKCLQGCSPREWYEFLNRRVFFWVTEQRVQTLLNAKAYRAEDHLVLTVDSARLLESHEAQLKLSPINSGSTIYRPVHRGLDLFQSLSDYPYEERRRVRGAANAIAEVSVDYAVPNVSMLIDRVERRRGNEVLEVMQS